MTAQAEREGRFLGGRPPYGYRVAMCRELGLTLKYDHVAHVLTTDGRNGTITVGLM